MEINRNNVKEIIEKCGLKPDKDYGQNFLLEPQICSKIIDSASIKENDKVLEIGPGIGSLTHFIDLKTPNFAVVDIDKRMIEFLEFIYSKTNIEFVNDDIRKVDVSSYDVIIGNLPYNITTELVLFLLQNASKARSMVLMCQLEAFARFNDLSGENYGPLSVLLHLLGKSNRLFTVKAGSFYPIPKCQSIVFKIEIDEHTKEEKEAYLNVYKMCKQLFLARRKTIYNNLSGYLGDKDKAKRVLEALNIDPLTRPEQISYINYLKMYEIIKK